jgi:hypothetical protein
LVLTNNNSLTNWDNNNEKSKECTLQYNFDLRNLLILLISMNYPVPHSHKTFDLGGVIIDSNFDSGNLFNA